MSGPPALRFALVWVAALLAPLALRAVLVFERTSGLYTGDALGVMSDAAVAGLMVVVLLWLGRVSRFLAVVTVLAWVLLHYASYETVRVLGSIASYRDVHFMASATFLEGSALAISRPLLLASLAAVSAALAFLAVRGLSARWWAGSIGAALLLFAAHQAASMTDQLEYWRQLNAIDYNARDWLTELLADPTSHAFPDPPSAMLDLVPGLASDLDGELLLETPGRGHNVLLVVIEGLSGSYLPVLAEAHDQQLHALMPLLDSRARQHLAYSSFLVNQSKTNRGLYALLCGELPNLQHGIPKMTEHAMQGWRVCLPEVLADVGYRTVFAQAAPLAFMNKNEFMPRAGFARTLGDESFPEAYMRTKWGVDDRAFFEQVGSLVDELEAEHRPWFLTTLNVGTHHPFVVPGLDGSNKRGRQKALSYADRALDEFLNALAERGILDHTLVLITTDESNGMRFAQGVGRALSQSWGILIAQLPQPVARRIDERFSQVDIALSTMDYLGIADRGRHFFGRSIFRSYPTGRLLFFANSSRGLLGSVDADNRLSLCLPTGCQRYGLEERRLFGRSRSSLPWDTEHGALLHELARRSVLISSTRSSGPRALRIVAERVELVDTTRRVLSGGQYVDLAEDEWLEIELEAVAHGPPGHIQIAHHLRQGWKAFAQAPASTQPIIYATNSRLSSGEIFRLHYTLYPGRAVRLLQTRSFARALDDEPRQLEFRKGTMHIRSGEPRPLIGLRIFENSTRASPR